MSDDLKSELAALKERGLTFGDCVEVFGVADSDKVVQRAIREYADEGRIEIDGTTVLSASDEGAYVMAWLWVEWHPEDDDE